jgi:hypothetical protein
MEPSPAKLSYGGSADASRGQRGVGADLELLHSAHNNEHLAPLAHHGETRPKLSTSTVQGFLDELSSSTGLPVSRDQRRLRCDARR